MSDNRYNGWTNYETWRVNLELCEDIAESLREDIEGGYLDPFANTVELSRHLQESVEQTIEQSVETSTTHGNIALDYALAFINDVNWYEIAKHTEGLIATEEEEDE